MPHYYSNVIDGKFLPDTKGSDMPDLDTAKEEAIRATGEMLRELKNWNGGDWQMLVTDESGTALIKLTFSARIIGDQ